MTSIQPELWVDRAAAAVAFYEAAFGATVLHRVGDGEDIVAQLAVAEARFWVASTSNELQRFSPITVGGATSRTLLVVDDPETVIRQAVTAGASKTSPVDDEHGWRLGRIVDPSGHEWEIGRPLKEPPHTDYSHFIKKLELPPGIEPPTRLTYDDVIAKAINRGHLEDDVAGINASIDLIQQTRGGGWPTEPVTADYNYVDLVWHELEFREAKSFTYAVYYTDEHYLGCCYLYPLGGRTILSEELLNYDVDVSWWVTPTAYETGYYTKLYKALQDWLANQFAFWRPYYSNREIPGR